MIPFYKMSGSGNDFILIDNRDGSLPVRDVPAFVRAVCTPRVSLGADGVILIEPSSRADFRWRFYNADGSEAEMCGNGGRCAARFAVIRGIAGEALSFETKAGLIDAEVRGSVVKLRLTDPHGLALDETVVLGGERLEVSRVNTGVPHAVCFAQDLDGLDVFSLGRGLRRHPHYAPAGTNANFVRVEGPRTLRVRTYERGVEAETLACGTGATASALTAAAKGLVSSPVDVTVQSGEILRIYFEKTPEGFRRVYLEGKTRVVCEGRLWEEAYGEASATS